MEVATYLCSDGVRPVEFTDGSSIHRVVRIGVYYPPFTWSFGCTAVVPESRRMTLWSEEVIHRLASTKPGHLICAK